MNYYEIKMSIEIDGSERRANSNSLQSGGAVNTDPSGDIRSQVCSCTRSSAPGNLEQHDSLSVLGKTVTSHSSRKRSAVVDSVGDSLEQTGTLTSITAEEFIKHIKQGKYKFYYSSDGKLVISLAETSTLDGRQQSEGSSPSPSISLSQPNGSAAARNKQNAVVSGATTTIGCAATESVANSEGRQQSMATCCRQQSEGSSPSPSSSLSQPQDGIAGVQGSSPVRVGDAGESSLQNKGCPCARCSHLNHVVHDDCDCKCHKKEGDKQ